MTGDVETKAALRKRVFARRKAAHMAGGDAALAARDHFLAGQMHVGAKVISGYRPILSEIDVTPLMLALLDAGHRLCVPVIQGKGQPLKFRAWTPASAMVIGEFGAEIPAEGAWLDPELLIAPLVAFDDRGWRLGYGGGFYDRTLTLLRGKGPTRAVGFAYSVQEVPAVPTEPTDQRLDAIVTERGLIRPVKEG